MGDHQRHARVAHGVQRQVLAVRCGERGTIHACAYPKQRVVSVYDP